MLAGLSGNAQPYPTWVMRCKSSSAHRRLRNIAGPLCPATPIFLSTFTCHTPFLSCLTLQAARSYDVLPSCILAICLTRLRLEKLGEHEHVPNLGRKIEGPCELQVAFGSSRN